jgi:hypothetical protein
MIRLIDLYFDDGTQTFNYLIGFKILFLMGSFTCLYDDMDKLYMHWYGIIDVVNSYDYDTWKWKCWIH